MENYKSKCPKIVKIVAVKENDLFGLTFPKTESPGNRIYFSVNVNNKGLLKNGMFL